MTKLRVSSHRLSIESGRWTKPNSTPLRERNCLFCNLLKDEYHFVLKCNLYNTLRKLIPKYYRNCPNMLKMYELINAGNSKVLSINHSIVINKAFKLKNSAIYVNNRF